MATLVPSQKVGSDGTPKPALGTSALQNICCLTPTSDRWEASELALPELESPEPLEVTVTTVPLASSVTVTVAFGITAPLLSDTVPKIDP